MKSFRSNGSFDILLTSFKSFKLPLKNCLSVSTEIASAYLLYIIIIFLMSKFLNSLFEGEALFISAIRLNLFLDIALLKYLVEIFSLDLKPDNGNSLLLISTSFLLFSIISASIFVCESYKRIQFFKCIAGVY